MTSEFLQYHNAKNWKQPNISQEDSAYHFMEVGAKKEYSYVELGRQGMALTVEWLESTEQKLFLAQVHHEEQKESLMW